jgi:hypothetical protein
MGWFTKALTFGEFKETTESEKTLKEINRIEEYYKDSPDRAYDELSSYSLPYMATN